MPSFRRIANSLSSVKKSKSHVNWHPGHMYTGLQAMIGKLNTVDCAIEVHDARIPLLGRNNEFKRHLGLIKPHILVLNKTDLADLSKWDLVKKKLEERGDNEVVLTDLTGSEFSHTHRGYDTLIERAVSLISNSERFNREYMPEYRIMIVGIPNVGKSTLINRLRQYHLGLKGEATKTGKEAGVTRKVENKIRICARPLIYSLDTPGVLQPSVTRNPDSAMKLALCSAINDRVLKPLDMASFLLKYLHQTTNYSYVQHMGLDKPAKDILDLCKMYAAKKRAENQNQLLPLDSDQICWKMIRLFRNGYFGKVLFM